MESKHIIQAFQETLADLPPVEQTLRTLQFTEKMDELEVSERDLSWYTSGQGRESIARRPDKSVLPSREDSGRRTSYISELQPQQMRLVVILGIAGLVLLIVIIIGLCMIFGGNKSVEPDDLAGTPIESEPGYTGGTSTGDNPGYSEGMSTESGYDDTEETPIEPDDTTPAGLGEESEGAPEGELEEDPEGESKGNPENSSETDLPQDY